MKRLFCLMFLSVFIFIALSGMTFASTTIKVVEPDTGNLDNALIREQYPTTTYYTLSSFSHSANEIGGLRWTIWKYDLPIPEGVTITDSTFFLYVSSNVLDEGEGFNLSAHHVYDSTIYNISGNEWTEEVITWNTKPDAGTEYNTSNLGDSINVSNWFVQYDRLNYTILDAVQAEHAKSNLNLSIMLIASDQWGSPSVTETISLYTKNTPSEEYFAHINITYETTSPVVYNVTTTPNTPYTIDTLNCSAVYVSSVSGGSIEFIWYKNDALQDYNGTALSLVENTIAYTNKTVDPPLTGDDVWICSARAYNTTDYGDWVNSSSVTILSDTNAPIYSNNSTNSTLAGTPVMHSLYETDNIQLSGYTFSFDNCTGSFVNDSWVSMTGTGNWSNVTKTINSTSGCTIRWCVYINDTSGNINGTSCDSPFNYETTSEGQPIVNVTWITPISAINIPRNNYYNITVNVSCSGGNCGDIWVYLGPKTYAKTILQDDNTELIADARVYAHSTGYDINYGTDSIYRAGGTTWSYRSKSYLAWNTTQIPSGGVVNSLFADTHVNTGPGNSLYIGMYEVYDWPWKNITGGEDLNETTITWNNQPCGTGFDNSTNCNLTLADENYFVVGTYWKSWNLSNLTGSIASDDVFSVILAGTDDINNNAQFEAKEGSNDAWTSRLNVTWAYDSTNVVINHTEGTPVYQVQSYPQTVTLNDGESQIVTFTINGTGSDDTIQELFVWVNQSTNESNSAQTSEINFTIQNVIDDVTIETFIGYGYDISLNATITEPDGVDFVKFELTYPNETSVNFTATNVTSTIWNANCGVSWQYGIHNITVWLNDSLGNMETETGHYSNILGYSEFSIQTMVDAYAVSAEVNLTDPPGMGLSEPTQLEIFETLYEEALQEHKVKENLIKKGLSKIKISMKLEELSAKKVNETEGELEDVIIEFYGDFDLDIPPHKKESKKSIMLIQDDNLKDMGIEKEKVIRRFTKTMNGIYMKMTKKEYNAIKNHPNIKASFFNTSHQVHLSSSVPLINADDLWAINDSQDRYIKGTGITVAILDTGIDYTHTNFGNCTLQNVTDGNCARIAYAYDFVNDDADVMDGHMHGTHVAGIVGGQDATYTGVAPNVTFYIYKVCSDSGSCPDPAIISAIENATAAGVDIITMSFGSQTYIGGDGLETSLKSAHDAGILISASAGNDGPAYDSVSCPGCYDFVISVGSSTKGNSISSFSSRGWAYTNHQTVNNTGVDILAPGSSITSSVPNEGWYSASGTSMSCPHIAGVFALIKQAHPDWNQTQIYSAITNPAVDLGYDTLTQGSGRVDALKSYNVSGIFYRWNQMAGQNDDPTANFTFNFTLTLDGLNRNDTYLIACVNESSLLSCEVNDSSISIDVNGTGSIFVNGTVDNTNSHHANIFGFVNISSGNSSLIMTVPFAVWNQINDINCPIPGTVYNTDTTFVGGLTCQYAIKPSASVGIFSIGTDNVTVDCNGTILVGSKQSIGDGGTAVSMSGVNNATIKNCNISSFGYAIYSYGNNNKIINNTVASATDWVISTGSNGTLIANNSFIDSDLWGIWVDHAWDVVIERNTFDNTFYSIKSYGAEDYVNHDMIIRHNTNNKTGYGYEISSMVNTTIYNETFEDSFWALEVRSCKNASVENITITQGASTYDSHGITISNPYSWYPETENYVFRGITVDAQDWAMIINGISLENTKIYDCIVNTTDSDGTDILAYENSHSTIVNCSFNASRVSVLGEYTWMIVSWYGDVNITDENGTAVSGATVNVYENSTGSWELYNTGTTAASGIARIEVPQINWTLGGQSEFYVNITAEKNLYYSNSTSDYNLSTNTEYDMILQSGAPDIIDPTITVVWPANTTYNYTGVTFSITTDENCSTAWYSLDDGSTNHTMTENTPTNFTNTTTLSDTTSYTVNYWVNDTSNNTGSATVSFTIDTSYTGGFNKSMINKSSESPNFKGYLTMKVQKYFGGSWTDHETIVSNSAQTITGTTALDTIWYAAGSYTTNETGDFRVFAEFLDDEGNVLQNSADGSTWYNISYNFTVGDVGDPIPTIVEPTNNEWHNYVNITLNYTVIDDYNSTLTCYYILDSNETESPNNPVSNNTYDSFNMSSLSDGAHTVYVKCDDSTLNGSSSTITFYVDTTNPILTQDTPLNGSNIEGSVTEEFTVDINESLSINTTSCILFWKYPGEPDFAEVSMNYISIDTECTTTLDLSSMENDDTVNFYFQASDMAGNTGNNGTGASPLTATKTVDSTPPILTITSPLNQSYETSNIWFNVTADENISTCLVDYGAGNKTMSNTSMTAWYHNNASVAEGSHQAIFWCNDTLGNPNTTSVYFNISLDTSDPVISSVSASSITSSSATITWTTDESANSSLSISPAGTYSNSASYTTSHSIAVTGLSSETNYTYNVTSCDASGNCAEDTENTFETIAAGDGGGGGGGCTPSWICTDWSSCIGGLQTRTCEDENNCDDISSIPDLSQACTMPPPTTPLNRTNFTIADMGNYTWPWSPTDVGVYHPTRLAAVVSTLMVGNMGAMLMNIVASLGDYYYRPSVGWGILSILFMHITIFVVLYLIVGLIIKHSKMLSKTSTTFKFLIYVIIIPLIVLLMTLLLPTV